MRIVSPGKDLILAMIETLNLRLWGVPSICLIPIVIPFVETFVGQVVRVNWSLLDERPNEGDEEVEDEEQDVHEQVLVGGSQTVKREV